MLPVPGDFMIPKLVNFGSASGTYSYQDENGIDQLVVYKYLKDRDWVFMVRDDAEEVYGEVAAVRVSVGILCAVVASIVILATLPLSRWRCSSGRNYFGFALSYQ